MAVAVCDLGTFSGLILIAEKSRSKTIAVCEESHTVDLVCEGLPGGRIGNRGLQRAARVLRRFERLVQQYSCTSAIVVCTEALRRAPNRASAVAFLQKATRCPVRVVTQGREAALSAEGARSGLSGSSIIGAVIDIGGGSTEIVTPGKRGWVYRGVAWGAAKATAHWVQHRRSNPWTFRESACCALADLRVPAARSGGRIVGVGGTIVTLASIDLGLREFVPHRIHGHRMTTRRFDELADTLWGLRPGQIAQLIPFARERARVLTAGTFLWAGVLNRIGARQVTVSVRGLRWGMADRLLAGRGV